MNLTRTEARALQGILDSDYMDGETLPERVIGKQVWTWSANPFQSKRTFSGAVSSLVRKGLAKSSDWGTNDAVIWITKDGLDALTAWKTANPEKVK